jgi:hypothetical protein
MKPAVKGRFHNFGLGHSRWRYYLGLRVGLEIGNHNSSTKSDGKDTKMVAEFNNREYLITSGYLVGQPEKC